MKIVYKQGAQIKCKPQVAYREIERIRKENDGEINLDQVVRDSKLKDAPLHNEFEWNDKKAAHKLRLQQARYIVGSIEVIREEKPNIQARAYEVTLKAPSVAGEKVKRVYKRTEDILSDPVARNELLAQAIKDAIAYRRRYHALSELAQVFKALDDFVSVANI